VTDSAYSQTQTSYKLCRTGGLEIWKAGGTGSLHLTKPFPAAVCVTERLFSPALLASLPRTGSLPREYAETSPVCSICCFTNLKDLSKNGDSARLGTLGKAHETRGKTEKTADICPFNLQGMFCLDGRAVLLVTTLWRPEESGKRRSLQVQTNFLSSYSGAFACVGLCNFTLS
jgi:hypothetical protein